MKALITILLIALLSSICFGYLRADLNEDGTVNFLDLIILSDQWLMSIYNLKFGGAGYVTVADDDVLDFGATDSALICFWGKQTSTAGAPRVFDKLERTGSGLCGWLLHFGRTSTEITLSLYETPSNYVDLDVTHGATVTDWNHYAFLINRSDNTAYGYVNGTFKNSADISSVGSVTNDANLIVGAHYNELTGVYSSYLDGHLEDIRVYKNSVTDSNVASVLADIYNSGVGRSANDDDFTDGWYSRIDDGKGLTVSGRKISSGAYTAHNGTISSLSDVEWASGGVPFDDGTTDANYTENTYYINRTGKTIQFRFSGYNDSQLKEYKILTPTILSDR